MRRLCSIVAILLLATAVAVGENHSQSLEIDASSFRAVQTDALSGVAIDKIGLDLSRRPCARLKMHVNRMTREEIAGLTVKVIGGNVIVMRSEVASEGNGLIIELTAKNPTRFYLHHDTFGDSNEVSLNLEGDKEYRLEASLNQFYPITVTSNVKGGEVYVDDRLYGKTNDEFYLLIHDILPGEHTLRVEHAGRRSEQKVLVHKESLVFRCNVEEASEALDWLVFQVSPSDATLLLDGKVLQLNSGVAQTMLLRGSYNYEVSTSGFHTEKGMVVMDGAKVVRQVKLAPAFGWLTIASNKMLHGATVYIDDVVVGKVPITRLQVGSGTHKIELLQANYKPYSSTFVVNDAQSVTLNPELVENSAAVTLVAAPNVEIWVNEERVAMERWEGRLEPGTYKVECKRENHKTTSQVLNISDLTPCEMQLEEPKPIVGALNIVSEPAIAKVYLDGKPLGETPLMLGEVIVGDHKVRLELEGYNPCEVAVIVREGVTEEVSTTLHRLSSRVEESQTENNSGMVEIRFKDSRTQASVFVNGKYLGATNRAYMLTQGLHAIVVRYGEHCYGEIVDITPYTHTIDLSLSAEVESPMALSLEGAKKAKQPKQKTKKQR